MVEQFLKKLRQLPSAFFIFIISFAVLLPGYDKFWAPLDEGFIIEASYMSLQGMVPYKDFLIVLYPPGQIYLIALFFKIFSINLIVPRIFTIIMQSLICASVFYVSKKISSVKYAFFSAAVCLTALAGFGESIPRPIWPGIALGLLGISFIANFIYSEKKYYLIAASFFTGITLLFRQDIGLFTFLACIIAIMLLSNYAKKKSFKLFGLYSFFPILFVGLAALWLYKVGALKEAFYALFIFPKEFCRGGAISFPVFCFNFGKIFHDNCYFIRANQFYIPFFVIIVTAILIFLRQISRRGLNKRNILLTVILLLSIFYLQQYVIRTDTVHLAMAFAPSAILFGGIFSFKYKNKFFNGLKIFSVLLIALLMLLYAYVNIEQYIEQVYKKPFLKKSVEKVNFKEGALYLPDDIREEFIGLVKYVKENTAEEEKIYIGSLNHSVPQFGWYDLIYILARRLPAVKYYEMHPGLQNKENIQKQMIASLKRNNTKTLLLRDYKTDTAPLGVLDKYIREGYVFKQKIGSYRIYVKK